MHKAAPRTVSAMSPNGRRPALHRAGEFFENVDQPGGRLQHSQSLRQFFLAVDVVEQLERALIGGMLFRLVAESPQPFAQFGAACFKLIISLAKAPWPAGR